MQHTQQIKAGARTQVIARFNPAVYPHTEHNQGLISRNRAAYLLRAASSRRSGNINRVVGGYHITDANLDLLEVA